MSTWVRRGALTHWQVLIISEPHVAAVRNRRTAAPTDGGGGEEAGRGGRLATLTEWTPRINTYLRAIGRVYRRCALLRHRAELNQPRWVSEQMSDRSQLRHRRRLHFLPSLDAHVWRASVQPWDFICTAERRDWLPVGSLNTALASACVWTMLLRRTAMLGTLFLGSCFRAACRDEELEEVSFCCLFSSIPHLWLRSVKKHLNAWTNRVKPNQFIISDRLNKHIAHLLVLLNKIIWQPFVSRLNILRYVIIKPSSFSDLRQFSDN